MNKLEEIAGHIRQAQSVCFITGAGASISAGIPTAEKLIDLVCQKYAHCLNGLSEVQRKNYGVVMSALSPEERETIIKPLLDEAKINWGHIALLSIAKKRAIKRILTFNFDLVLEATASLLGMQFPVYDFATSPTNEIERLASPAIFHLHGQSFGLVLLNSDDEVAAHREKLRPLLADTVRNNLTVVIGYSGVADGAHLVLEQEYNRRNRLLWLGYTDAPPVHLGPLLANKYAEYVGGCDFDQTMIQLAKLLNVWPPEIFANPLKHLLSELSPVAKFPQKDEAEADVLEATVRRLGEFAGKWEQAKSDDEKAHEMLIGGSVPNEEIEALFARRDRLSESGKNALAWVYTVGAISIAEQAKAARGAEARALYAAAYEKYKQALIIKPNSLAALNNWGVALSEEARKAPMEEAAALFDCAREKLLRAKKLKGKASYNLACLFALTGDSTEALRELATCVVDNMLPSRSHLEKDSDLDSLRELPEFQEILRQAK